MELSSILEALSDTSEETTKTASHSTSGGNNLEAALDAALSMEKTASIHEQASPSGDLVKIAQRLADAEQLALVKEAEMYGAAVCDGFLARMNEHDESGVKVAGLRGSADVDELLIKQAMELGYRETKGQLERVAQAAYAQGHSETTKLASQAQNQEQEEATKLASEALRVGYSEGKQMIKQAAEDSASRGYQHAINILGSLA